MDAARAAGDIARSFWRKTPDAWEKPDGAGPVSEADMAVNAMLEHELRTARPDYGWLSEESIDDAARLVASRTFIIDPIDGTRAFLAGEGSFAHSLAIAQDGQVMAAVVYLPVPDLIYTATLTGQALLNGIAIAPSATINPEGASILTAAASADPSQWRGPVPDYKRAFRPSLAWRLCLVAEGRFDATLSLRPAWEWDIAAGALIATRAGAAVTDRAAMPLYFNRPVPQSNGLIAAPTALHAALTSRIRTF